MSDKTKEMITVLICPCCHWLATRNQWRASEIEKCVTCRLCDTEYSIVDCQVFWKDGTQILDYTKVDDCDDDYDCY